MKFFHLQASRGSQRNYVHFLLEHPSSCDCGICFGPETKFQRFCSAVMYARYVYLNEDEFSKEATQSVFKEMIKFWEDNRNDKTKFPRSDMFYVMSARMLLYAGHFYWKIEDDKETAVTLLKRGLKGLNKAKYGIRMIKQDLELQIGSMEHTIKELRAPREKKFIRIMRKFDDEPQAKAAPTLGINLKTCGTGINSLITPNARKPSRYRRANPVEIAAGSRAVERPKRNLIPTIFVDLDSDSESSKEKK